MFVLDCLTTLWLAGLREEFASAVKFVSTMDFSKKSSVTDFADVASRGLGSLISAYQLSGDAVLKQKAVELADRLVVAFHPASPFPSDTIDVASGSASHSLGKDQYSLVAIASFQLEFRALTNLTGDAKYQKLADESLLTLLRIDNSLRSSRISLAKPRDPAKTGVEGLATVQDASTVYTLADSRSSARSAS